LDHPSLVLAYYLLRYTGQRRGDVALMKRADFDGTAIKMIQEKTSTPVWIPCHPILRGRLAVVPRVGDYMILSPKGGHWRGTSITNEVCEACKEFGLPGYSPHGLRHLAGAALAEAGCTVHEIMAILGHLKESQVMEYVRQANRKTLAQSAMIKWEAGPARRSSPGTKGE
jgi:integrase